MKVVVVDDSAEIAEVVSLCFKLRWSWANVLAACDGTSGLQLIEAETPDIVILDVGLPDMSGFEVLQEVRRFSQVPVIMLTVRGEDTDIAKGLELGADDYVTKPFSHIELIARVQAVLRRAQGLAVTDEERPFSSGKLFVDELSPDTIPTCGLTRTRLTFSIRDDVRQEEVTWVRCVATDSSGNRSSCGSAPYGGKPSAPSRRPCAWSSPREPPMMYWNTLK